MKAIRFIGMFLALIYGCRQADENKLTTDLDFSIYLTTDSLVNTDLVLNNLVMETKPFIKYGDIISYDSAKHILELNYKVDTIFKYNYRLDRRGFVAVMNNTTKIYCGTFWSPAHSDINSNIAITLPIDGISNDSCLKIIAGHPNTSYNKGYSIVNDKRIIELFKKDRKIK